MSRNIESSEKLSFTDWKTGKNNRVWADVDIWDMFKTHTSKSPDTQQKLKSKDEERKGRLRLQ